MVIEENKTTSSTYCNKKKRYKQRKNPKPKRFRRKKHKKFQQTNANNYKQSQGSSFNITQMMKGSSSRQILSISYGECFWNNYKRVMSWNNSYMNDYWKVQANKLHMENTQLKYRIDHLLTHQGSNYMDHREEKEVDQGIETEITDEYHMEDMTSTDFDEEQCDNSSEYEVTEEFMKFIQISLQHKQDMQKNNKKKNKKKVKNYKKEEEKEIISSDELPEVYEAPSVDSGEKRLNEMKQLYGSDSAKIHGMETAVHLAFLRKCDKSKPCMWPVLPLRS